jgi:uncharacterized protein (TIGR03083 family)
MSLDYLTHLRADSARFAEVLAHIDSDTPVPSCPDWTAADLLWHLGEVQHSWGTIVRDRLVDWDDYRQPARPQERAALLDFFDMSSALLIDALASTDDDVAVWTWLDTDQSVGFVRRRQAHEALIHRLDAELAGGAVRELDASLATDGVLEALEWMFGGAPGWATTTLDGPVGRVATTDTGANWLLKMGHWSGTSPDTGTTYTAEPALFLDAHGEPSFEISGTAGDLDAWMWNRPTLHDVTRTGDTTKFEAVINTGVQ